MGLLYQNSLPAHNVAVTNHFHLFSELLVTLTFIQLICNQDVILESIIFQVLAHNRLAIRRLYSSVSDHDRIQYRHLYPGFMESYRREEF